jgi:anti-sigma regulatory factor (Ser/Thr protein kinase)
LEPHTAYQHEALLYRGTADFLHHAVPFIRDGLEAGEPVLVVTAQTRIGALRAELGGDAAQVEFADMAHAGSNPARIIPLWRDFIDREGSNGRRLRGIGEPIWAERSPAELAECQWHESLLNLAIEPATPMWLLCPYDALALDHDVIQEAHRSHPMVTEGGHQRESGAFRGRGGSVAPFTTPLPAPPSGTRQFAFGLGELATVRGMVAAFAAQAGLDPRRNDELVAAAHEVATNSVRHGGGRGALRLWRDDRSVICDFTNRGRIDDPMVGRERPLTGSAGGRGLWLANQMCDLVQIRTMPTGTVVRLHKKL